MLVPNETRVDRDNVSIRPVQCVLYLSKNPCRPSAAESVPPGVELLEVYGERFVSAIEAGGVGAAADDLDTDHGVTVVVEKLQPLVRLTADDCDSRVLCDQYAPILAIQTQHYI